MTLLIKWILAHLIGDFLLQPSKWIEQKERLIWRSPYLYLHVLFHFLLLLILTADIGLWYAAAIIAFSHLVIDSIKLRLQTETTRSAWFFTDQLLHLLVIVLVWAWIFEPDFSPLLIWPPEYWLIVTGAIFLTIPASSLIQHLMSRWSDTIEETQSGSLQDAGKYIGILERLFIFISILAGFWQTVGFLIAAKSVFRFGDLSEARNRKLTEYILIGTLLSFGIALAIALLVRFQ
jgi:hypothetical protein